ncbi:hypothetical protein FOZ60_017550 [Perkinsus olseni]|uniref:Uncharacterized protein n=1 Tax=Perkinsus olseni TaxID=32597 RepID=A0A7J6NMZ8_PEROL|nr:hypothetical protein FOZ60_017550 [Perkinsus olseni]
MASRRRRASNLSEPLPQDQGKSHQFSEVLEPPKEIRKEEAERPVESSRGSAPPPPGPSEKANPSVVAAIYKPLDVVREDIQVEALEVHPTSPSKKAVAGMSGKNIYVQQKATRADGIASSSSLRAVPMKHFQSLHMNQSGGPNNRSGTDTRDLLVRCELAAASDEGMRKLIELQERMEKHRDVIESIYAGVCLVRIGLQMEVEEPCEISNCSEKDTLFGILFGLLLCPLALTAAILRLIELQEWWTLNRERRSSVILSIVAVGVAAILYTICLITTTLGYGERLLPAYCGAAALIITLVDGRGIYN